MECVPAGAGFHVSPKTLLSWRDCSEGLCLTFFVRERAHLLEGKAPSQLDLRGTEQPESCPEEETLVLKPLEEQSPGPPGAWPAGGAPSWRNLAQNPHGCPAGLLFAFGPFWTLLGLPLPLTRGPAPVPDPPPTPLCLCFLAGVVRELSMPGAPC